jgi:hypothetical protein
MSHHLSRLNFAKAYFFFKNTWNSMQLLNEGGEGFLKDGETRLDKKVGILVTQQV